MVIYWQLLYWYCTFIYAKLVHATDTGLQADKDVHDGVVLMKDSSKFWKKAWSHIKSYFTETSAKEEQLCLGVQTMFPNWIKELRSGKTVEDLITWCSDVQTQQCERIAGYPKYTSDTYSNRFTGQRLTDKVLLTTKTVCSSHL